MGLSTRGSQQELAKTQGGRFNFFFIKEEVKPFCRAQYCLQVHASAPPGAVGCAGIGKELGLSAD